MFGGVADAVAHLGGLQVCQSKHGGVGKLAAQGTEVLVDQSGTLIFLTAAAGHGGSGVGVGGVEVHTLSGQAGGGADILSDDRGQLLVDAAQVGTHQNGLGVTAGQSQGVNFQFVQNAFCIAGLEVTGHKDSQHGGDVYTAETSE